MPKTTATKTTTTTTTRASSDHYTHYRFNAWVSLMVLSLVAFIALIFATDGRQRDFNEKWGLAMAGISMCIGFLATLGHGAVGFRERFISSLLELSMAIICVIAWILALPMITAPDDGLAVNHNFQIDNANLYFASWGSFIFALFLLASVGNERGVSAGHDALARRWFWIVLSSLVVMAAASQMYDRVCTNSQFREDGEFCKELRMGISLSVISAFIAGVMTLLMWFSPALLFLPIDMVGAFLCICILGLWIILVAYLTFDEGPATTVGNLFFGVWVSAILALDLFVCYAVTLLN